MKRLMLAMTMGCAAQIASAGVYVELVDHDVKSGAVQPAQKMYVQAGSGRFVDPEGRTTLIKGDTMYILDDSDKSYIAFDKATMQQLAQKIGSAMEKQKEMLAKLPPEQRAQVEQAMGSRLSGLGEKKEHTVEAIDTGKSDKVEGRACKVWDIKRDGELDDQYCVVAYASLPGKENFQEVFANFAKVFDEMTKSVPMLAGMMGNEFAALNKIGGYPVRQRGYDNGKLDDSERIVKIWREEAIPASQFELPAGYKKKTMPMGPGQ